MTLALNRRLSQRSSRILKPGELYENDKPREALHRCGPAVYAAHGIERSGAKHPESAYFIQQVRDPLHARTCLSV